MTKLVKIAGIVIAIHALVFLVVVQPGCHAQQPPGAQRPEAPPVGDREWDDTDFQAEADPDSPPRERYAPRRPESETLSPADDVADDLLRPLPSEPVRRAETSREPYRDEEYTTYTVRSGDSLWVISQRHRVSLRALLDANNLTEGSVIQPGQELVIPGGSQAAARTGDRTSSAPPPEGTTTYTVQRGDSLSVIAQRHRTTVSRLKELNNLRSDTIQIDQKLIVPENGGGGSSPAPRPQARAASGSGQRHVVASGETPGGIARHYGISQDELMQANNISDPRRMQVGQELIIPGTEAAEEEEPAPTSTADRERSERRETEERTEERRDERSIPVEPLQPRPEEEDPDDIPVIPIVPRSN